LPVRESVTFIHTADVHLDAPFQGIGEASERVGRALAESTYEAFRRVVDTALAREVDFVVIAGNAYNARDKSLRAQLRFREQMNRLAEAGIDAFVAQGNHDPASGWSAGLTLPENVRVFSATQVERFEVTRDGHVIAAVYGRSFARPAETTNLSLGYRRETSDPVAVAVLHANVGGIGDYDPYAPASLQDLRSAGMDYWALGHIHKYAELARDPFVVYAGSPQGLNPKETGPHGCVLVEIGPGGDVKAEHIETAPIAWAQATIDCAGVADVDAVRILLADTCEALRVSEGRNVVARIALTGRTDAHADLARTGNVDALLEELRAEKGVADPWVWVDRIDDRTSAVLDLAAIRGGADFAAEALRIADELAADPTAIESLLQDFADPLGTTLGGYASTVDPSTALELARDAVLDVLLSGDGR
jgi:DNA repair exonuclease SbcCD nuclease subunit